MIIKTKIIIVFISLIIFVFSRIQNNKFNEIRNNGMIKIAEFSSYKKYVKSCNYYFTFFDESKKKKCYVIEVPRGFERNLGKYYKLKYLRKYPELIIVEFDKEIKDTLAISKAGF